MFAAQEVPDAARLLHDDRGRRPTACATTPPRWCSAGAVHKSVRARCCHRRVELHDDGWAILSLPPGRRDLGERELWERSLARSRRRREYAALQRSPVYRKKRALVSAALLTATVLAPDARRREGPGHRGDVDRRDAAHGQPRPGGDGAPAHARHPRRRRSSGRQTRRAVRSFQARTGSRSTASPAPITRGALGGGGGARRAAAAGRDHDRGPARARHQRRRRVRAPRRAQAVRAFQASRGLEVDGVVGPQTLGALGISGAGGAGRVAGGGSAVAAARTKLGAPYALGGVGPTSWDCSGLTQWAFAQAGVTLPRTSFEQASAGVHVDRAAVQAGDLVFFDANGPGASHVGIATSNGDGDLRHHPRRARARDHRLLLGQALLRRAPRRLSAVAGPAIEVSGLVKTFGDSARSTGSTCRSPTGEVHGFLGPNGAGKSTTIRVLLGLLRADAGAAAPARRRPVARRGRAAPPARLRPRRRQPVAEADRRRGDRPARPAARRARPAAGAPSCSSASSSTRPRRAAPTRRATARRSRSSPRSPPTPSCSSSTSRPRGSTR